MQRGVSQEVRREGRSRHLAACHVKKPGDGMRRVILVFAFLSLLLAPLAVVAKPGHATPGKAFKSNEELLAWITTYRSNPEPRRLPDAVLAMRTYGATKDMDQAGVYIGFSAGVIGSNPEMAEKLIAACFPMPPQDQVLLIKAIAYSGLPDWKGTLKSFVERMPARRVLIEKFLYEDKPVLADLAMDQDASAIDVNWGYYYATGAEAPMRRIVKAASWSLERNDVEKLTIGAMAKWTLAQNASRDPELLDMLKGIAANASGEERKPLAEVIEAAETLELAKIRKSALASIEDLRAKGPESSRNLQWWGQAGQTVLALGCVAAGALGQVEFGIPCVIGGATSTAVLKYLVPSGKN